MTLEKKQLNIVLKNWKGVFKMEKVKINQEQADKIWGWEMHTGGKSRLLELHAKNLLADSKCLQSLSLDELARALYVGYEVEVEELEPQFEVGDWVINAYNNRIFQLEQSEVKDFFELLPTLKHIRHATESEIAGEEKSRTNKKLDEILLDLSEAERDMLYERFGWGDY